MAYDVKPLTKEEITHAKQTNELSDTIRVLETLELYNHLNIGDTLVALYTDNKGMQTFVKSDGIMEKYKVVHKDEYGLVYVKRMLLSSNRLSTATTCINKQFYEFTVDPTLAEAILLDSEEAYDPSKDIRARRSLLNKVRRLNKDRTFLSKDDNSDIASEEIIKNLKVGDKFYYSWHKVPEKLSDVTEYEVTEPPKEEARPSYSWNKPSSSKMWVVMVKSSKSKNIEKISNMHNYFKVRPATAEQPQ